MNILLLSRWFPFPPDNGSRIRIFNLVRQLAVSHSVSLLAFEEDPERATAAAMASLGEHCVRVQVLPYHGFNPLGPRALGGLLALEPRFLVDTHSPAMEAAVAAEVARHHPDLLIASQLDMLPYALRQRGVPSMLEELQLSSYLDRRRQGPLRSRLRATLTWVKLSTYLRRMLPSVAVSTVVSEQERRILKLVAPTYDRVEVIPNALDLSDYGRSYGAAEPNSLVFAGALSYDANLDAARFLVRDILPQVAARVPEVHLRITGSLAGVDLDALPRNPRAHLTGYVDDIHSLVARSWASVVPIRAGGGTRLKILESMALGTPVVATLKGAEGLDAQPGEHYLLGNEADEFARQVVSLLKSPTQRERLAAAGRDLLSTKYDWQRVGHYLREAVARAAA